jgi:alpha-beta hydrolase superfamily lysophospholipase
MDTACKIEALLRRFPIFTLKTYTVSDGYRCHYRDYPAAGTPRGRIVFVHGIQSHAGWYEHSCHRLSEAGFAVTFLDRRGSGQNTEARGDTPSFRRLLDDIAEYLQLLRQQSPALPIFLGGISWGGKPVTALQRRHPGLCDGLALLCPGFRPQVRPSRKERLGIILSRLLSPRRMFAVPLSDPLLFTATPRWQEFIRDDPLSLRQATARFFVESVRLDLYLRFVLSHVHLPVLLLLAEHDRIIDNTRTRAFVERFPAADKEVHEYTGAHHTLEFEENPEVFLSDLLRWLERQSSSFQKPN